ncbi:MAG: glycosyltransferase family 4 protein [Candidatus Peribacteraceae bacterium]|nr:glycosyltransferase family 4 protein [Candidatus Peribacteraceae bacterium]
MKILLIGEQADGHGGWSTYTRSLRQAFRETGHAVSLCCARGTPGDFPVLDRPLRYLSNPLRLLRDIRKLRAAIRASRPDIIHITVEPYALFILFLPAAVRGRTVLTIHGSYGVRPFLAWRTRWLMRRAFKGIGRFITVSNYTKGRVRDILPPPLATSFDKHCTVIPNGIELPPSPPPRTPHPVKRVLTVGEVKPRKGILEALESLALYREKYGTAFSYSIVGRMYEGSSYQKALEDRITALALTAQVTFPGMVSNERLEQLYAEADLYLQPAKTTDNTFEGFGLVYLEANARGVPCIGPTDSGAAEAIDEGRSGFRVDPDNPDAMADLIHRILDEGTVKSENCRAWAEEHGIAKTAQATLRIYGTLVTE